MLFSQINGLLRNIKAINAQVIYATHQPRNRLTFVTLLDAEELGRRRTRANRNTQTVHGVGGKNHSIARLQGINGLLHDMSLHRFHRFHCTTTLKEPNRFPPLKAHPRFP